LLTDVDNASVCGVQKKIDLLDRIIIFTFVHSRHNPNRHGSTISVLLIKLQYTAPFLLVLFYLFLSYHHTCPTLSLNY